MPRLVWGLVLLPLGLIASVQGGRPDAGLGRALGAASPLSTPERRVGEWIWTRADADGFERARAATPAAMPALLAATIELESGAPHLHLGLAPESVRASSVAFVVRLDDSLHGIWDAKSPDEVAREVGGPIAGLVTATEASGVSVSEVQLDYDAPVRRLGEWADCVAALSAGPLAGRALWVTSIPAQLEDPSYGARLAGHVQGHVLQLFDIGLAPTPANVEHVASLLAHQPLSFRIGVGAFERRTQRGLTDHAGWIAALPRFSADRRFAGAWLFPAGRDTRSTLATLAEVAR